MHGLLENDWMFSSRGEVPWHEIGTVLDGVPNSREAIKAAKLGWLVKQEPVFSSGNFAVPIPGYLANVRSDTKEVLGIVSERYRVAQNKDVFAFADALIGSSREKCAFETAGSLFNGRRVFILVNMPKGRIVGDEYQPYLCLSNSHDGSTSLQLCLTGIRVVCNNTLSAALATASRKIAIRHLSCMGWQKDEAVKAMGAAGKYFRRLEAFAEELAGKKVSLKKVLDILYPAPKGAAPSQIKVALEAKEIIQNILKDKDDLQNFKGTAWGAYQAVADYRSNAEPKRRTPTYADSKMARFLDGDSVMREAQDIIEELAA